MNKYILIPHDQYLSVKAFVAENRDTQGKQQSLNVNNLKIQRDSSLMVNQRMG